MRHPALSEAAFQGWVVDVFKRHGWLIKHAGVPARPTRGGRLVPDRRGTGMLDLLLIHDDPPRILFAECKDADGRVTVEQQEVIQRLRPTVTLVAERFRPEPAPLGVHLFRPGAEATIEEIARGRTR